MSDAPVICAIEDSIAHITLNTPDNGNVINLPMAEALSDVARRVEATEGLRAVMIDARGKMFCAGGDIRAMDASRDDLPGMIHRLVRTAHDAILRLGRLPVPVVGALNGAVAGGGLGLAMCADYLVAADNARFCAAHTMIGLSGDCGVTFFLPRVIGLRRARRMTLTNETINAETALDWGLIEEVVAADALADTARERAAMMAGSATNGLIASKKLTGASLGAALEAHLGRELEQMVACSRTHDAREGIDAFANKRTPAYTGR
ncbi:enoyl-CoA hydratase-related protein [Salinisphaera sp. P385]|uniref:Enoyl-CoA hydratase-related protein n=1 Tax=Spectribacter acetivorans TaxID=3075603 RepID=A0ABU3B3Q4_9GAMM|nr:enoyl-CoA hydratase-related protein [Salinisphaera sp. P385]MDT0617091.1 enoyl-CoA hydratase-related protein [Salinisphaera sp. P385]